MIMKEKIYDALDILQYAVILLTALWALTGLAIQFCWTPTGSMAPTIPAGGKFITSYCKPEDLQYDDIVTFVPIARGENVEDDNDDNNDQEVQYCKRVIGLPGDVIEVRDGCTWRNGEKLDPDYVIEYQLDTMEPYTVPEGTMFCMGDNRNNSLDSRCLGAFKLDGLRGKVIWYEKSV